MVKGEVVIPKTWRSEIKGLGAFLGLMLVSVILSRQFPGSVVSNEFSLWGDSVLRISLPLFWFVPFGTLLFTIGKIYNVRFTVDSRGIRARVGILAWNQRITRVRYEDIRSVETEQSLLERALDIGNVEVATAATGNIEIVFDGVAAPKELQEMIQIERDRRQKVRDEAQKEAHIHAASA